MTLAAQDLEAVRTRLAELVGKDNVASGPAVGAYSIGGEMPVAVVSPEDEAQAAEVAKLASAERLPVIVWGGGTKQDVEPVQPTSGIVLSTGRLNATIELDAANLTVTVAGGKVLDDLQRELAAVKMFLPLDPVDSARATIGGSLATNSSGPNRLLYRTARDLVLGVRVATPFGTVIRAGGKTVKDVAGYDMKKLYIGSWGTLGAITATTMRLLPLPEERATVVMSFPKLTNACAAVMAILGSFMRPSTAELVGAGTMKSGFDLASGEYLLMVQAEGAVEDVERQKRELGEIATKQGATAVAILEGDQEAQLWKQRKDVFAQMPAEKAAVLIKSSVLLKRVVDFVGGVEALKAEGFDASVVSHAGNGIVYAMISCAPEEASKLAVAVSKVQRLAGECGGFALLQKGPAEVVAKSQIWPPRTDYGLMRDIKAQLDPANLWNPARTPGGRI